jgi:hypothetical protein
MRKFIATLVFLCVVAGGVFGQTMVNVKTFATYYGFGDGIVTPDTDNEYYWAMDYNDHSRFGAYEAEDYAVDTAKEWFLAMACGISKIKVTDAAMATRIESVLPSNNPKQKDLQAGAIVYMDVQIDRFLGDTATVNRHEAVLQFITGRGNATRAEIEKFYRDNVRGLVSDIVDEQLADLKNAGRRVNPSAKALSGVKNAITEFMLAPSEATYRNLLLTYHRGDFDGSGLVLGYAMVEINPEISRTLANNKVLTGAR